MSTPEKRFTMLNVSSKQLAPPFTVFELCCIYCIDPVGLIFLLIPCILRKHFLQFSRQHLVIFCHLTVDRSWVIHGCLFELNSTEFVNFLQNWCDRENNLNETCRMMKCDDCGASIWLILQIKSQPFSLSFHCLVMFLENTTFLSNCCGIQRVNLSNNLTFAAHIPSFAVTPSYSPPKKCEERAFFFFLSPLLCI